MSDLAPPPWLADEEEIRALLHAVLDRFDEQPGSERQRPVLLSVQQCFPSLERGDGDADRSWTLIRALEAVGVCSIRTKKKRNPFDPEWHKAKLAFALDSEPVLRDWVQRPASERALESWRRAVAECAHEFTVDPQILLSRRIAIAGRSDAEIVAALLQVGTAKGALSLRQLSARAFWGDSKILDDRADLIQTLFPNLQVRERPVVAAIHLPETIAGTLFIENQDTYALATTGCWRSTQSLALIYAAGFRGTAARIRSREGVLLHYAGPGARTSQAAFERWWFDEHRVMSECWFWGDLDFAGMQILKALRLRFGDVRAWQPGYEPMLQAVQARMAHRGGDRAQVDPGATGCTYADTVLLPAIREHGYLDQEWIAI